VAAHMSRIFATVHTQRPCIQARLAAWVVLPLAVTASGACSPPPSEPVFVVAMPTPAATQPVSAPPAPLTANPWVAPQVAAPEWLPIRSTTPGKIQCETLDCDLATEVCCFDESKKRARCVPNDGPSPLCDPDEQERACDESSDCTGGARCCREFRAGEDCGPSERWACHPLGCGRTGDPSNELCLPGSACAQGACRESGTRSDRQGLCPADTPPMACGSKRCAAGEFCCWTSKLRRGSCVKSADDCPYGVTDPSHSRKLFFCQSPADCPSKECFNATAIYFDQSFECGVSKCNVMSNFLGPRLCRSDADCPQEVELSAGEMSVRTHYFTDCSADKDYPPGVKVCHYRQDPSRFAPP
jgi:hypothetical protein